MIPYWCIYLYPALFALQLRQCSIGIQRLSFGLFAIFAISMIGLRYEVGGDWLAYLDYVEMVKGVSLLEAVTFNDPGYMFFNWLSVQFGLGIGGVNTLCGTIFVLGLIHLCREQPFPWLGLAIAIPFMLIVVSMGFSRQAVALGIIFFALVAWSEKNFIKYSLLVILAFLFHKSAIIMFFLGFFIDKKYILAKIIIAMPVALVIIILFVVTDHFERKFNAYVVRQTYQSEGGLIRVLMNVVPSFLFFLHRKKFKIFKDYHLLYLMALASLFSLVSVSFLSMVTDRFALYLAPIQILVYTRIVYLVNDKYLKSVILILILSFYALVLLVWLFFSSHSIYWLPYKWIPVL